MTGKIITYLYLTVTISIFYINVREISRERLVKLLQAELECLRGPINEDDLPLEPPCLIHIWIPSAFLTGQSSDIHHVYQVSKIDINYNKIIVKYI